jgi:hypothetical protein
MNLPITFLSNMSRREKKLTAAIAALLLLMAGYRGYNKYQAAVEQYQSAQLSAEQTLSEARVAVDRGHRARSRLLQWRKASLPANHDIARSLYQDWLRQELTKASIQVKELRDITSGLNTVRPGQMANYRPFTFSVHAQATLEELAKFLQQFYTAPHLHTISTASLKATATPKPTTHGQALDIKFTIEALAVPGCRRTDQLASQLTEISPTNRNFEQLLKTIQDRNPFTTYQAKPETTETAKKLGPPTDDAAKQAKVTEMTYGGSGWRLAIRRQDSGQLLYFRTGDHIHIGQFEGTIGGMDGRQVLIETASEKRTLRLGQSLVE